MRTIQTATPRLEPKQFVRVFAQRDMRNYRLCSITRTIFRTMPRNASYSDIASAGFRSGTPEGRGEGSVRLALLDVRPDGAVQQCGEGMPG